MIYYSMSSRTPKPSPHHNLWAAQLECSKNVQICPSSDENEWMGRGWGGDGKIFESDLISGGNDCTGKKTAESCPLSPPPLLPPQNPFWGLNLVILRITWSLQKIYFRTFHNIFISLFHERDSVKRLLTLIFVMINEHIWVPEYQTETVSNTASTSRSYSNFGIYQGWKQGCTVWQ